MAEKTLTGALGIIRVGGLRPIGGMLNVQITENFTRTPVPEGIGSINDVEMPVTKFGGTLSAEQVFIDLRSAAWSSPLYKSTQSISDIDLKLIFDSNVGVSVDIFKRITIEEIDQATGQVRTTSKPIAVVSRLMIESQSFSIQDGQFSTTNFNGRFLDKLRVRS